MLNQHEYYVYHEDRTVYARMGKREPVIASVCATAQDAYDTVQSIINPNGLSREDFAEEDGLGRKLGFLSKEFQNAISGNCEAYVKEAYSLTKPAKK